MMPVIYSREIKQHFKSSMSHFNMSMNSTFLCQESIDLINNTIISSGDILFVVKVYMALIHQTKQNSYPTYINILAF